MKCTIGFAPFVFRASLVTGMVLSAISGCASSPKVEYFTLEPLESPSPRLTASLSVQMVRVHVPPTLDRKQMVRHRDEYSLDISDQHRWSAPLDQMIRRVLTEDLIRRLPEGSVILPEEPASSSTDKIVVDILEFAPDASGTIRLEASWSLLLANTGGTAQSHFARLSEPASPEGAAGEVSAMSRVLSRLAAQMAQTLAASPGSRGREPMSGGSP